MAGLRALPPTQKGEREQQTSLAAPVKVCLGCWRRKIDCFLLVNCLAAGQKKGAFGAETRRGTKTMRGKIILYAEDDPNDVIIFKMAFRRATLPHDLHFVEDGQQAVDWLSGNGKYADRETFPLPDILILDLKMPKKTGFDVLEWVRNKREFEILQVIILSSSDVPDDVKRAYQLGATTYFVKSASYQDVIQYLRLAP